MGSVRRERRVFRCSSRRGGRGAREGGRERPSPAGTREGISEDVPVDLGLLLGASLAVPIDGGVHAGFERGAHEVAHRPERRHRARGMHGRAAAAGGGPLAPRRDAAVVPREFVRTRRGERDAWEARVAARFESAGASPAQKLRIASQISLGAASERGGRSIARTNGLLWKGPGGGKTGRRLTGALTRPRAPDAAVHVTRPSRLALSSVRSRRSTGATASPVRSRARLASALKGAPATGGFLGRQDGGRARRDAARGR